MAMTAEEYRVCAQVRRYHDFTIKRIISNPTSTKSDADSTATSVDDAGHM